MENMVKRIRSLCKEKGTSLTKLEAELGFGNGTIGKWAKFNREPKYVHVKAIADYFGVSVSELTGEQKETPSVEPEADDPNKKALFDMIDRMSRAELILLLERAEKIINSR